MKTLNFLTSACRACRYYRPEGRRGGLCQQLGVPVRGSWSACSLALPPFAPSWEKLEGIVVWPEETLKIQQAASAECASGYSNSNASEEKIAPAYKNKAVTPARVL